MDGLITSGRKKQAGKNKFKIDALLNNEKSQVLEKFNRGVSAYLRLHFAWEEHLLSEGSREGSMEMKWLVPDEV